MFDVLYYRLGALVIDERFALQGLGNCVCVWQPSTWGRDSWREERKNHGPETNSCSLANSQETSSDKASIKHSKETITMTSCLYMRQLGRAKHHPCGR